MHEECCPRRRPSGETAVRSSQKVPNWPFIFSANDGVHHERPCNGRVASCQDAPPSKKERLCVNQDDSCDAEATLFWFSLQFQPHKKRVATHFLPDIASCDMQGERRLPPVRACHHVKVQPILHSNQTLSDSDRARVSSESAFA